jgi:hypothetical protein
MTMGLKSEKVYLKKNDYQTFSNLLTEEFELWEVKILAYSLMPKHYHHLTVKSHTFVGSLLKKINEVMKSDAELLSWVNKFGKRLSTVNRRLNHSRTLQGFFCILEYHIIIWIDKKIFNIIAMRNH